MKQDWRLVEASFYFCKIIYLTHIDSKLFYPSLTGTVNLSVSIMEGTGQFEITENESLVVSGRVFSPNEPVLQFPVFERSESTEEAALIKLSGEDIYKELRLRGYDYGPTFQGILETNNKGNLETIRNLYKCN